VDHRIRLVKSPLLLEGMIASMVPAEVESLPSSWLHAFNLLNAKDHHRIGGGQHLTLRSDRRATKRDMRKLLLRRKATRPALRSIPTACQNGSKRKCCVLTESLASSARAADCKHKRYNRDSQTLADGYRCLIRSQPKQSAESLPPRQSSLVE